MRLFYKEKPRCHHITEIMDAIRKIYEFETVFDPYLSVEFLPNKDDSPESIILIAGPEVIKKDVNFDNPEEVEELRKLLWSYLILIFPVTYFWLSSIKAMRLSFNGVNHNP